MQTSGEKSGALIGVLSGVGAALCWAVGLVYARHGIVIGFSPSDLVVHRFVWPGLLLLPLFVQSSANRFGAFGWGRAVALTVLGGPALAFVSYFGFQHVPLGHGAVIQPSSAALGGIVLAAWALGEPLPRRRVFGAVAIVLGLIVLAGEAATTIGAQGLIGDFAFALAGLMFATFGMLLRRWRISPVRATIVMSVMSLALIPVHALLVGYERMSALGFTENLVQAMVQGALAGAGATYLFTRSVELLGASRAAVFPSLVPAFTLLVGYLALGEIPTLAQFAGLAIVLYGFRLTQRA